ncbi:putative uncharacterized protein, partial [Helicobacter pylori]
KKTMLFELYF